MFLRGQQNRDITVPLCYVFLLPLLRNKTDEAVCSLPFSAEVKYAWSYTSTPSVRLCGVVVT